MKEQRKRGKIILLGAGPGEPGLLTLKGAEALKRAEAVVYDWLVNPELLEMAPGAEKIFAGKKGGTHYKEQKEINRILLKLAREGKWVVRLKGGDPFIFGRGGEEAGFLAERRIPFEVIPGVSAGTGVPAAAGIPLTDRRFASQVTFVTGHEDPTKGEAEVDWKALASLRGTIVSFMGVKNLPAIVSSLLKGGKPARTPAAVIERGTLPAQKVITGTLKNILSKTRKARIESPALAVIGEVVRLREKLGWFEKRPLHGKTVVVTRSRAQASELAARLKDQGAEVIEFPTIEILPPSNPRKIDREIQKIFSEGKSRYDWIIFTSVNGTHFFFERLKALRKDARIFSGVKIAVIGAATREALQEKGLVADLVPAEFTSQALFQALRVRGEIRGKKILLARTDIAPPDLREALEEEGARVVEIEAYRTRPAAGRRGGLPGGLKEGKIDYVTFTSSSTVKNFFESIPRRLHKKIRAQFVSIGPVTSQALQGYGVKPAREARIHTIEGLVDALSNGK